MKIIIVLALLLSGCAGVAYDDNDDESLVHRAAMSWVGAPIAEMVGVWGEPNNLNIEATESNDGLMRWRETRRYAGTNLPAGAKSHTCIVEAYFGMDGTINRVETMTNNCDDQYTEEQLELLTR
jgi:hypothetical protein